MGDRGGGGQGSSSQKLDVETTDRGGTIRPKLFCQKGVRRSKGSQRVRVILKPFDSDDIKKALININKSGQIKY